MQEAKQRGSCHTATLLTSCVRKDTLEQVAFLTFAAWSLHPHAFYMWPFCTNMPSQLHVANFFLKLVIKNTVIMSLLSEKVATVLQGQVLFANSINSNDIATDVLVVSENVSVQGAVSAPAFLTPFQFQAFPENTADTTTITGIPEVSGINMWRGSVLAPNGKIYNIPFDSTSVLIVDPVTNTADITTITGLPTGNAKYQGCVLAPNGKIYGIPCNSPSVLIIDPVTNTADTTTITGLTEENKYTLGALGLDGKIYGMPRHATSVLIIDPVTNTADTTSITGLSTGLFKWAGGVLGPDGKIYGIPNDVSSVLIIDPSSLVVQITAANSYYTNSSKKLFFGASVSGLLVGDNIIITVSSGLKYTGYIQSINSSTEVTFIYALSLGADIPVGSITKLEKTRKVDFTTIATVNIPQFMGGALGPDGKIYCMPSGNQSSVLIIDPKSPVTNISTSYGIVIGNASYVQSTKTLSLPGATATSGLVVGDNIIITTANTQFSALIQTLTNTSITFYDVPFGVDITAGNITKLEKTNKADVTTITGLNGRVFNNTQFGLNGAVLGPNGKIYGMPRNCASVLILDPSSPVVDISTSFGINVATAYYTNSSKILTFGAGATLLTSGLLVGDNIIITVSSGTRYTGYIQSIDSNTQITLVYNLSLAADIVVGNITKLEKTRKADVTTITGLTADKNKTSSGVLAPNGIIYGSPLNTDYVLRINTGLPTLPPWMLQAYFNKF